MEKSFNYPLQAKASLENIAPLLEMGVPFKVSAGLIFVDAFSVVQEWKARIKSKA